MTFKQILKAIQEDGKADELFGIEQLPRIADGTVMIVYLVKSNTPAFNLIPPASEPVDGYWLVAHVHNNGKLDEDIDLVLYTKQGQPVFISEALYKLFVHVRDDSEWYLVRDLSNSHNKLYAMQRSLE